jgi:hypothetical protein
VHDTGWKPMLHCERVGITRQGIANCSISILHVFLGQILAESESSAADTGWKPMLHFDPVEV